MQPNEAPAPDHPAPHVQTVPHDHTHKTSERWQIVEPDRIELIQAANSFIDAMVWKTTQREVSLPAPDLTDLERVTYQDALRMLGREFRGGPRCERSHVVQSDMEKSRLGT
jgi:hypothetical protein